ncbi:carbohydrate porin [Vibrio sp. LaRot3]|uniref:carbohydrate porin n=1 Tax=Vibrio sp. LaRot3 TaxID=2998829 RepID=UPI0022CDDBD6|nr:carbohydrate porin [Vibrio sp. LaRot3]MDA0150192.1 carbohydrate porin [Vibrio sp. LaRot3]
MKKVSLIAAAVAASLAASSAFAVDFNGFVRASTGVSGETGADVTWEKAKLGRLGNQGDNYYEFGFNEELQTGEQTWRVESMIAQGSDSSNGWVGGDVNVAQFAVKAKGLFEFDREATLWAGKTYYQRKDVHISDFYFLDTSGTGIGIEGVTVGEDMKLSFAVIEDKGSQKSDTKTEFVFDKEQCTGSGTPADDTCYKSVASDEDVNAHKIDLRLANIGLWENASLELAAVYNFASEGSDQTVKADDGVLATAIVQQGLDSGFNQTVFQYGTSSYGAQMAGLGAGSYFDRSGDNNDANGFRIFNWGVAGLTDNIEIGHNVLFAKSYDVGSAKVEHDLMSVVVRPMYKWNENMRSVLEVGYFTEEKGADKSEGNKVTLAQAWAMGNSWWARPEIRIFGTYITDEEGTTFGDKGDSDFILGASLEAWF